MRLRSLSNLGLAVYQAHAIHHDGAGCNLESHRFQTFANSRGLKRSGTENGNLDTVETVCFNRRQQREAGAIELSSPDKGVDSEFHRTQLIRQRITSVDALRGLVMIIMALDHTRDYLSSAAQQFNPENLSRTTAAIFFTRWITHFCAPTFMFAAGLGAFLWLGKKRTTEQLGRFLWARGLWLVVLELTAMRFALGFNMSYKPVMLIVLWVLGLSMMILALLVKIPPRPLAILSLLIISTHNLLDKIPAASGGWGDFWRVLHQQGVIFGNTVVVSYPLIPWFAVMAAGYCFGPLVKERRTDLMIRIGAGMTVGFVILRALNIYGDPRPWTGGLLSFLNCTKYPPSLEFLLMTLGPSILVLAWFDRFRFGDANPLIVFGRVPLFFFVLHFLAIHVLAVALAWFRYGQFYILNLVAGGFPKDYGYSLPMVYVFWAGIVIAFYPLCRWFAGVKARRTDWWLSYL